jgi:hypothetical protein
MIPNRAPAGGTSSPQILAAAVALVMVMTGCDRNTPPSPVSPSCAFSVSSSVTGFGAAGGTGTVTVATSSGCGWSASSQVDWIGVDDRTHTGSGSVTFTVAGSEHASARTGALTVASQSVQISQAGVPAAPCTYTATADKAQFERDGGSATLTIATAPGCAWALSHDANWIALEGTLEGHGSGSVRLTADANEDAAERRATLRVANAVVGIAQAGQGDCTFDVSPIETSIPRLAWTGDIRVATERGCRWTASSGADWLRLRASTGSGSGILGYEAAYNPETRFGITRTAPIEIRWRAPTAGQNVRIRQWGDCYVVLAAPPSGTPGFSGASLDVAADGGTFHLFVLTEPWMGCAWTASAGAPWVTLDFPRAGQVMGGDGDVRFTVPANASSQERQGVLLVGERALTVVQRGRQ